MSDYMTFDTAEREAKAMLEKSNKPVCLMSHIADGTPCWPGPFALMNESDLDKPWVQREYEHLGTYTRRGLIVRPGGKVDP